jgi:hypothetical protein
MKQSEKLARMIIYAHKVSVVANNLNSEGNDYDESWHRRYVRDLNEISKEMLDILKKK